MHFCSAACLSPFRAFRSGRALSLAIAFVLCFAPGLAAQAGPDADTVLKAIDRALFLESYASSIVMETVEPGGTARSLSFDSLARRDTGSYLEVSAPSRSKGTRFLQLEGSLWMYNPRSGGSAALRLSARESFQGSTFSNADVGKTRFADDYAPSLAPPAVLEHEELGAVPCVVIESLARNEDAAYGKIVMWARKSDLMPLRMDYYAKSGLLFKRMDLSAIKDFGDLVRPSRMRMESLEKKGTVTTITVLSMKRQDVPLSVFAKAFLTR